MSDVNGTQWMLEESKRMLRDRNTPPDVRKLANAVVELVAQCRASADERDRLAMRLEALLTEIDQGEVVYSNPDRSRLWAPRDFIPQPTASARLIRRQEIGR